MRIKRYLFVLLIPLQGVCGDLRSVPVKEGDCSTMEAGFLCYSPDSQDKIDDALRKGVKCQERLALCEVKLSEMSGKITNMQPISKRHEEWRKGRWFLLGITAATFLGLGAIAF